MTTRTDTLLIKLETDGDGKVKASLAGVEHGFERLGKGAKKAGGQMRQLRESAIRLTSNLKLMAIAAPAAFAYMTGRSLEAADSIEKTAQKLGLGIEELQEWRYAARSAGIEQATFDMAVQRFGRRVGEAAMGTGELKDTLKRMNIEVRNSNGSIRAVDDILPEFLDKLSQVSSESERNALAMKGFDSEGVKLVQLAARGADGMARMRQDARELGIVLDEDLVRNASDANEKLTTLKTIIGTQITHAFITLAPQIDQFAKYLIGHSKDIQQFASDLFTINEAALKAASSVAGFMTKVGKGMGEFAASFLHGPGGKIRTINDQIISANTQLQVFRNHLENLRNSKTDQTPAIAGMEREIAKVEKRLENLIKLKDEALSTGSNKLHDTNDGKKGGDTNNAGDDTLTKRLQGIVSYADEVKLLTQERVDAFVRSLDTEIEAEQRRYEEGLLLLAEAREQGLEIEGGYYEAREALRLEHESRMAELSENAAINWEQLWTDTLERFSAGVGDAVANAVVEQKNLADAMQSLLKGIGKQVISSLVQVGVQMLANHLLSMFFHKKEEIQAKATGKAVAEAWSNAAAAASLASFGGNAIPAMAGMTATYALSRTLAIAGQAHDGLDYVPRTGTYILEEGERVVKKEDNQRLTKAINGSIDNSHNSSDAIINIHPGNYSEHQVEEIIKMTNDLARKGVVVVANKII